MIFESLLNILKENISGSLIKIWHLLIIINILIIIIILSLIPLYINKNIKENVIYIDEFNIGWFNGSPDGYERSILGINNKIPCPRIIVNSGDIINIKIKNNLLSGTSIHWHGLYQINNLHMDGVPGITQCLIMPNETFIYKFSTINQTGTYWYHSHNSIEYGDGLKGILIIKDKYDPWNKYYIDEDIIELTDWYHIPVYQHLKTYLYPGTIDPIPDNILINSIGQFNCQLNKNCSFYRSSMKINQGKRFRIINTSIYARITLTIDQHIMRLIEIDGIYLDGNKYVKTLRLTPGQRYSILINGKNNSNLNYWIRATIHPFIEYNNKYNISTQTTALAILEYNNSINIPSIQSIYNENLFINQSLINGEIFSDEKDLNLMNLTKYLLPKDGIIKTYIFNSEHQGEQPGYFYINNQTFIHPINNTLLSKILYENLTEINWSSTLQIENNQIIDIIINNMDFAPHPFHLHGHHVWILEQGNTFDGYKNLSNINYNLINPIYRDTFTVNSFSYVIFRFKTNNPGIWMLHCHNDWHLQLGMAFIFIESKNLIKQFYSNQNLTYLIPSTCQYH